MDTKRVSETYWGVFDVYRRLKQIVHHVDTRRDEIAKSSTISGASLYLLGCIYSNPNTPYKELAAYSGLAPNTVSSLVSSLIEHNLVRVTKDTSDKRIGRVSLTDAGNEHVDKLWAFVEEEYDVTSIAQCKSWLSEELTSTILNL